MQITPNIHSFAAVELEQIKQLLKKRPKVVFAIFLSIISLFWFWFSLPKQLFDSNYSTVVYAADHTLLGARIAKDEQWRFPEGDSVPYKFRQAIVHFEDRYFFYHLGINPFSICRALYLNIKHQKTISGGSTLSMQVIRLHRKNRKRSFWEKLIEIILAFRLELGYSKSKILSLYSAHAPFGGNTVGLEAAAWRYFQRPSNNLSWSEAATLAVLPNNPSGIYPGKNQKGLLMKRNKLLDRTTFELAICEPLPAPPGPIPQRVPHLLLRAEKIRKTDEFIQTTLNSHLQAAVQEVLNKHYQYWKQNEIYNLAALVVNNETGEVLAYIGNAPTDGLINHQESVDIISAPRSTGSVLKPFLFASVLEAGLLFPNSLILDIPLHIYGYSPQNFNLTFDGVVPAKKALGRSLNVPAVRMLQQYGTEKFLLKLRHCGMTTLNFSANHYGLSLILGGAEGSLWDLVGMYANLARGASFLRMKPISILNETKNQQPRNNASYLFSPGVCYLTLEAMAEVARPDLESSWKDFSSGTKVAWKTGTSFGFRDAWAIGVTSKFSVGVWVGNATGEGRPGLTGISAAAPMLFDIFSLLPKGKWFDTPKYDLKQVKVCASSGYTPNEYCPEIQSEWVQKTNVSVPVCPYHKLIFLDKTGNQRVTGDCYSVNEMKNEVYFVLPPVEEWYFKSRNPAYRSVPPYMVGCEPGRNDAALGFIYPTPDAQIFIPRNNENKQIGIVCRATHKNIDEKIYWMLDGIFQQITLKNHEIVINPEVGKHQLSITDTKGEQHLLGFEVLEMKSKDVK